MEESALSAGRRVMPVLALVCLLATTTASAQQPASRFEIAAQASLLRFSDFRFNTPVGIGGRVSYDVNTWLTFEGEVDYFPTDKIASAEEMTSIGTLRFVQYRRRTEALVGVKAGTRGERLGVFLKARPGVARLTNKGTTCLGPGCALVLPPPTPVTYRAEFVFDAGGGIVLFPGHHLAARMEISDMIIRHHSNVIPCPSAVCTTHNLSTRMGLGVRF
jgi:hypothetical protein